MQNVSHENDLIFMTVSEEVSFIKVYMKTLATEAKVNLELAYSSMSCLRAPLIIIGLDDTFQPFHRDITSRENL